MNRDADDEMTTQMTQKRLVSGAMGFLVALGCGVSAFHGYAEDEAMEKLLKALKERGSISDAEYGDILKASKKSSVSLQGGAADVSLGGRSVSQELLAQRKAIDEIKALKGVDLKSSLKDKWYEKLSIRGYVQTRYTTLMSGEGRGALETFNDPTLKNNNQLFLRRGRMIFSGDAAEHVYLYAQIDYQASVGATSTSPSSVSLGGQRTGLQTRDLYADISIDKDKEHRFRLGISKVPYGWVNLQSSQNRLSIERPDALNSAVEGERDLGFYYMWADKEARQRFRDLVRTGLKGSGDYGVFAFGAYNGQTLNQNDANRNQHLIARLTYPFRLDNGQYIEAGFGGYAGRVVVPGTDTPGKEYTDRRASAHFILYPQPFGIEAEWTVGEGPENMENNVISTKDSATKSFNSVGVGSLQGGYVTASYKIDSSAGTVIPFSRWQYFDGARKLGNYAPKMKVNEVDFGIEYQPWPEFEIAAIYTRAFERTSSGSSWNNTIFKDQDRFTLHMQFNY